MYLGENSSVSMQLVCFQRLSRAASISWAPRDKEKERNKEGKMCRNIGRKKEEKIKFDREENRKQASNKSGY